MKTYRYLFFIATTVYKLKLPSLSSLLCPVILTMIPRYTWAFFLLLQGTTCWTLTRIGSTPLRTDCKLSMALGDYYVELNKPLGIILEERDNNSGVKVKELVEGGAASSTRIVPGDVLLQVNNVDVSTTDFDSVMDLLISSDGSIHLSLGDGLGQMDMPKNVMKLLRTKEEAFFIDAVVREAVRECRKRNSKLGDLLNVEVIIGAGVKEEGRRGQVRFFAIFSTDGVSTYSCNVAATGILRDDDDENIQIVALSCAKDEGLGQTYELIREAEKSR